MPRRPRIAVVGSINLDLVARCKRLPQPGETVTDAVFERVPGGKGANQAVAAARLGADVEFVGCVGHDEFGRVAVQGLEEAGVDLSRLKTVDAPTGVALISVAADGENTIVVAPGANVMLRPEDVSIGDADGVLCQLEIPISTAARAAAHAKGLFCLNAAPARPLPRNLIRRTDLIVVNGHEFLTLEEEAKSRRVAVTLGADGATLLEGGNSVASAKPPLVKAVDGTAAGDAFCAALVVSVLEGRRWDESLRRACAAGALAASRFGAQPSLPTAAEVDAILAE